MLSSWKIAYSHFNPAEERLRETLCTLGNGYFATRGAAPESPMSKNRYPGTYMAGLYNKLATQVSGRTIYNDDLVNCPNWLGLTFRIGEGDWVTPDTCEILKYHQELDMRNGVLSREIKLLDKHERITTISTKRIVSMANPHRAAILYEITPENYEGWIVVKSSLDGSVQNKGVQRYKDLSSEHLVGHSMGSCGKRAIYLSAKTSQSKIEIALASRIRIASGKEEVRPSREIWTKERKRIFQEFRIPVRKKQRYSIEKTVSIFTSKDADAEDPIAQAVSSIKNPPWFDVILAAHTMTWAALWGRFDIEIKGDVFSQAILRFHIFHLIQTASPHNTKIDASLPARGLHGEPYRGHIFWDNVFVMHIFDLHHPEISRSLLMYRYRRLPQARRYARENGHKGAMFPWQSASTGEEETQEIHLNPKSGKWDPDHSRIQRHVSFAIAYNVWQYWQKTRDSKFLQSYGAEMLLSIAKFGASMVKYSRKDHRYHTEGIMGPDEFHEKYPGETKPGVRDNSYTNMIIVWTLLKAEETLKILPQYHKMRLLKTLGLNKAELDLWKDITYKMNVIINDDGIISQFDGFFGLKELDWLVYRKKYHNIKRLDRILKSEGKSPDYYKLAKQADVLMIFYLLPLHEVKYLISRLGYRFSKNMLEKNYDYYEARTSHGSTLSKVVHCYIAHLLGRSKESREWFISILKSDIHDTQGGTTRESIHAGVMGGSVDIAFRVFAGIEILDDRVKINPALPWSWENVKLKIIYRKHWIYLSITKSAVTIFIEGRANSTFLVPIEVQGRLYHIDVRNRWKIPLLKG
ncbi:MAG: glycosyl hydrolase family 65 protein [Candidatus Omnitrophota bacterium]